MIRIVSKIVLLISLLDGLLAHNLNAANDYWQQTVNYTLEVVLNDKRHELDGFVTIEYTNNSPDTLDFIYFHLWPNAYIDQSTAFAQQKLENGDTDFYYSRADQRGSIAGIDFKNGDKKSLKWAVDAEHPDIAKLFLATPLAPQQTRVITTPFVVDIPDSFSRLGHVGESYQICQWYPKPAVYDQTGWHPMPYLDQGEFYSEFGTFDVKITLPKNYVVGATGNLQNVEELEWLDQKAKATATIKEYDYYDDTFPPSASETKTLHYIQDNVHDFAWFADKRFHVLKGEVTLPISKRTITTWAMYTNEAADLWVKAIDYLNKSVLFYSKHLSEYPYDQMTAVESALSAGAGMEYPTITVIGSETSAVELDLVVAHEVGHNWFYGILASNERRYPWIDEGFNSYYEERYMRQAYPDRNMIGGRRGSRLAAFFDIDHYPPEAMGYYGYLLEARKNTDQAMSTPAPDFTYMNYWTGTYSKPAMSLRYVEQYLGVETFDKMMQTLYTDFAFKHLQPADIQRVFEKETGRNFDWFFKELFIENKKLDYELSRLEKNENRGVASAMDKVSVTNDPKFIAAPFSISAIKNDSIIYTQWYEGHHGEVVVDFPALDYDKLKIDAQEVMPEINRKNNTLKAKGLAKKMEPIRLQLFGSIENPDKSQLFFSPLAGFNKYDGVMLGTAFYNSLLPRRKFEYALAPMYGFKAKKVVGMASLAYNWYPQKGLFQAVQLKSNFRSFSFAEVGVSIPNSIPDVPNEFVRNDYPQYYRFAPELTLKFRKKYARSTVSQSLQVRHIQLLVSELTCDTSQFLCNSYSPNESEYFNEILYTYKNDQTIHDYGVQVKLQQGKDFGMSALDAHWRMAYKRGRKKGFGVRLFAGGFLWNTSLTGRIKQLSLATNGRNDYTMEHLYFGRTEFNGLYNQQLSKQFGGFNIPTATGRSTQWVAALNVKADVPLPIPIQLYGNFGLFGKQEFSQSSMFQFDIGLALVIVPDAIEVYVPLLLSSDIKREFDTAGKFYERISFYINLNRLNPIGAVRRISF